MPLIPFLCFIVFAGLVDAEGENEPCMWFLFDVSVVPFRVVKTRRIHKQPHFCHNNVHNVERGGASTLSLYVNNANGTVFITSAVSQGLPFVARVPMSLVESEFSFERGGVVVSRVSYDGRGASTLGSADVALEVIQELASPATQITVTFASSGYVASDAAKFAEDVQRAWQTLEGADPSIKINPAPWNRYVSTLNIYSLFQASPESGASMPHGVNHEAVAAPYCSGKGCEPFAVQNNLDCAYGTPHRKMLGCDWQKVMELASYAPASDLVVVLVNHNVYGGTGDPGPPNAEHSARIGVATIYNGKDMPLLLVHEVGHAFGGLSDEYSYGVSEETDLELVNCSPDKNKWAKWVEKGEADAMPVQPCSYTNYFRPTAKSCLMGAAHPVMCAVCKEQMSLSMYKKKIDISAPRCPLDAETVVLTDADEITLRVNSEIAQQPNIFVQWKVPNNVAATFSLTELAAPFLLVKGKNLSPGEHTLTATIDDNSDMVLTRHPSMTYHAHFYVRKVVDTIIKQNSDCEVKTCSGRGWADASYCSVCDTSRGSCNFTRTILPVQREVNLHDRIGTSKEDVVHIGGVLLGSTVGVQLLLLLALVHYRRRNIQLVVILTKQMKLLRHTLSALSLVAVISGVCLLAACYYYYEQAVIFGKVLLLVGMIVAGFLIIISLNLLVGAFLKVVPFLVVSAVLLGVVGLMCLIFGVLLLWFALNIKSESLRNSLQDAWDDKVASHASEVCTFQTMVRCSGFTKSCANLPQTTLPAFCPSNCDIGNRFQNSCFSELEVYVRNTFRPAGTALIFAAVFSFILTASTLLVVKAILNRKHEMRRRRKKRLQGLEDDSDSSSSSSGSDCLTINMNHTGVSKPKEPPLTEEEIEALQVEFAKADLDGSGALDREEAVLFWKSALGEKPRDVDLENASKMVDTNGDGKISFNEFIAIYQPFDHRRTGQTDRHVDLSSDPHINGDLTPADLKFLRRKFASLDKGCGVLTSKAQTKEWYRALYSRTPIDDELEDFTLKMDEGRQGKISFKGFIIPYKNLRKSKARIVREVLGDVEVKRLRHQFAEINSGGDSVLSTRTEFEQMYKLYTGESGSLQQVQRFAQMVLQQSNGIVTFIDYCMPFTKRMRRRKRIRQGLDEERIHAIRAHYHLLEKNANGGLTLNACQQLYTALYDEEPTERQLSVFVSGLDISGSGVIEFDEVMRIFAETARMTAAKRWLQGQNASDEQIEAIIKDFLDNAELEEGLRMGVPIEGYMAILRATAAVLHLVTPTTADMYAKFLEFDDDGDGYLCEMEFCKAHLSTIASAYRLAGNVSMKTPSLKHDDVYSKGGADAGGSGGGGGGANTALAMDNVNLTVANPLFSGSSGSWK